MTKNWPWKWSELEVTRERFNLFVNKPGQSVSDMRLTWEVLIPLQVAWAKDKKGRIVYNLPPPREFWANILPLLGVLRNCKFKFGKTPIILMAWMSPQYYNIVGGEEGDGKHHTEFKAIDFIVPGQPMKRVYDHLCEHYAEKHGIILYPDYVHLDLRDEGFQEVRK